MLISYPPAAISLVQNPSVRTYRRRTKTAFEAAEEEVLVDRMRCVQTNTQTYPLIDNLPVAKRYRWSITLAIIATGQGWRGLGFWSS